MAHPYPSKKTPVIKEFLIWFLIASALGVVNWLVLNPAGVDGTGPTSRGLVLHLVLSYFVFGHILFLVAVFRKTVYRRLAKARNVIREIAGLLFAFIGFSAGMFNLSWFGGVMFTWLYPSHLFQFNMLDTAGYWMVTFVAISGIGIFAISYYTMRLNLKESYRIHLERERLRGELETAREMQMGLMPDKAPSVPGLDIAGVCLPAREVGGDFFDYIHPVMMVSRCDDTVKRDNASSDRFSVAVADVSGKGMKAAMAAVMTSGMIHSAVTTEQNPAHLLRRVNPPLHHKTDRRMFVTMFYAVIDPHKREFEFVNAGQMPPLLLREGKVKTLVSDGPRLPLGLVSDVAYASTLVTLKPGDRILIFTDGVNEAMNPHKELFGTERLEDAVAGTGSIPKSTEALAHIRSRIEKFTDGEEPHDDITMVMVTVDLCS